MYVCIYIIYVNITVFRQPLHSFLLEEFKKVRVFYHAFRERIIMSTGGISNNKTVKRTK